MQAPATRQLDKRTHRLIEDYSVIACGLSVTILTGFVYDGASIPRVFWRLVGGPFSGLYAPAALVHDALYEAHAVDRKTADQVFHSLMLQFGMGRAKARVMYMGVRSGGWKGWHSYPDDHIEHVRSLVEVMPIK